VALADQVAEAARDLAEEMESLGAAAEPEQVLAAVERPSGRKSLGSEFRSSSGFAPASSSGSGQHSSGAGVAENPANAFPALTSAVEALGRQAAPGKWLTASATLPRSTAEGGDPQFAVAEEEVRSMLTLFAQLGRSRKEGGSGGMDANTFQSRLSAMPVRSQVTLQQALAGLAAQAPNEKPDRPMLLKLAEHVAIRFALDSYEKGELRVNAVKQLLDRMNTEIEGLRKILTSQEETDGQRRAAGAVIHGIARPGIWSRCPTKTERSNGIGRGLVRAAAESAHLSGRNVAAVAS